MLFREEYCWSQAEGREREEMLESGGEDDDPKRNQRGKRKRRRVETDLEDELARGGRLGQKKQSMKILFLQVLHEARTHLFSQRISLGSNRKP